MRGNSAGRLHFCLVLLGYAFASNSVARAGNPSVCLTEPTGCDFPGSTVDVQVRLGAGDSVVVGGQFQLSFDPAAFKLLEVLPGAACDALSPFSLEIHTELNESAGTIFCAVGINPFAGGKGTQGPATLACLRFLPRGLSQSDLCVKVGVEPVVTRLSDDTGHIVSIDNSVDCPPSGAPGTLTCRTATVESQCRCTTSTQCQTLGHACRSGVCVPQTQLCDVVPINEGGPCNDQNECTTVDQCVAGQCEGTGCTNPSLCMTPDPCTPPQSLMTIPVRIGSGDPIIIGGQFSVQWNPAGLEFVNAAPGNACDPGSPFVVEVQRVVDALAGELFYAAGVALGGSGTQGPATIACLYFRILDPALSEVCGFEDVNPFSTKLVDDAGQRVDIFNGEDCDSQVGFPVLNCVHYEFCEIPTASEWGLLILTLSLLAGAKIAFSRSTQAVDNLA